MPVAVANGIDAATPLVREPAAGISSARFLEIPGSGHCPPIEKPAEFIAAVDAFLADSRPATTT